MDIRILHIDDDPKLLDKASKIITNHQIKDHTLIIVDSCDFEVGMSRLAVNNYDLVILDLSVEGANGEKKQAGLTVFERIKSLTFVPIVFFTALPESVRYLESDVVAVADKAMGYDELFEKIQEILSKDYIEMKREVDLIAREGVRSFFWDFVHQNKASIDSLGGDKGTLLYLLIRRLGRTISSNLSRGLVENPKYKKDKGHAMEYYIYPPIKGNYNTGDILRNTKSGEVFMIATPACDMVEREKDKISASNVLLIRAFPFNNLQEYKEYNTAKKVISDITDKGGAPSKKQADTLSNIKGKVLELMGTKPLKHFFLPGTPFLKASLLDFEYKTVVPYAQIKSDFERIATVDDPICQAIIAKYSRYYSRVGYADLDRDFALDQIDQA